MARSPRLGKAPSIRSVHGAPEFSRARSARDRVIEALDRFTATRLQSRIVCVSQELSGGCALPTRAGNWLPWLMALMVRACGPRRPRQCRLSAAMFALEFARLVPVKKN